MLEILNYFRAELHIDPFVLIIVIASGFFQSSYLKYWNPTNYKDERYNAGLRTLIVSLIFTVVYCIVLLSLKQFPKERWGTFILSYFTATSIYELVLYPLVKKAIREKKKTG